MLSVDVSHQSSIRVSRMIRAVWFWCLGLGFIASPTDAAVIFSQGMIGPETISQAPAGFGSYGGQYFVPDAALVVTGNPATSNIWAIPTAGGAPAIFANNPGSGMLGGTFLPSTASWEALGGRFVTAGYQGNGGGVIYTYDSSGTPTPLYLSDTGFGVPAIAPDGFGNLGGSLVVAVQGVGVGIVSADGSLSILADLPNFDAFGLAFAPAGFGTVGGKLLVSNAGDGEIVAVGADGSVFDFANVPTAGVSSIATLRQMSFSPPGFLPGYGSLLLVSVSGSVLTGGELGDLFAVDEDGDVVAELRKNLGLNKFNPRGVLFLDDGSLLVNDTSDPTWLMTAADFQLTAVPEPGTLALIAVAFAAGGMVRVTSLMRRSI
jgi:hypothetical protein